MKQKPISRRKKYKKGDVCTICKVNTVMKIGYVRKTGLSRYSRMCDACAKKPWTQNKKVYCEECGMKPMSRMWLDVHHVDKDHSNNTQENLRTLCKRCHGLEHNPVRKFFNL